MNAPIGPSEPQNGSGLSKQYAVPTADSAQETLLRDHAVVERLRQKWGPEDSPAMLAGESLVNLLKTWGAAYERLNAALAPHGFSLAKYNLLAVLAVTPEKRLPMSEIGERMSVTCANITKLVDGLEQEGLVRRANRPGDRRVVLAELTPEGTTLMERLMPIQQQSVQRLWAGLSDQDCRLLTHLLVKLRHSVLNAEIETAASPAAESVKPEATHSGVDEKERQYAR